MNGLRFVIVTLLALLALLPATAEAQIGGGARHIAMALVAETDHPAPGSDVAIAFDARPEAGWHGYWVNPGDAGVPPKAHWSLPDGMRAAPLEYPVPQTLTISGIMNYVYEGPFALLSELHVPKGLKPGTALPVAVKLDYLVCTHEICVPESVSLSTELTVGDGTISPERRARFDRWRRALPRPLGSEATFAADKDGFRLSVPYPASAPLGKDAYFFPLGDGAIDYSAAQSVTRDGDRLLIETKAGDPPGKTVRGVLKTGAHDGLLLTARRGVIAAAKAPAGFDWATLFVALGGAILGGLILNIMPCVFPILSLKALGLARSGETQGAARAEALAYAGGVILTCLALGGVLLGLRAGGAAAGWAFQLQSPQVIGFLLLLVSAIALNLAGLFEIAMPGMVGRAAASGKGGAFATGALAAFIATPCTGPFMGAALGAALVLPWYAALAIFAGLGIGLALPFLAIGFVPALRRRLPKPGAWMETFRHILSIPMFATALALAWILGRQAGADGMAIGLGGALLLGFGLWWSGARQRRGAGGAMLPALILGLLSLAMLALIVRAPASATPAPTALGAQPFSEQKLASLRAEGRPVFAYFTADWCLTCKVNEKAAIETDRVAKAFADGNVAVLVGDWTDGDPELGRFIAQHNRAGVPLYLWYTPGTGEPRVLPQVLTPSMLAALPQERTRRD